MTDYGWLNDGIVGGERSEAIRKCRELGHKPTDIDVGPPHRGLEHVVTCELCQYQYRYDSSD